MGSSRGWMKMTRVVIMGAKSRNQEVGVVESALGKKSGGSDTRVYAGG